MFDVAYIPPPHTHTKNIQKTPQLTISRFDLNTLLSDVSMSQCFYLLYATHFSAEFRPWTLQTSDRHVSLLPHLITLSLLCVYQSLKALLADTEETPPPKPISLYDLCACLSSPLTSLTAQEPEQH